MAGEARAIADVLRARRPVDDHAFDQIYGEHVRRMSPVHWTPVAVAQRAAAWLAPEPGRRVLDVGAGPGKLCCIGALGFGGQWTGIEQHGALVDAAITAAGALEIDAQAAFVVGDLDALDWGGFDSLYFYNPFEAVLFGAPHGVGEAGAAQFAAQVARAEHRLATLAAGTRVVTFHGFGGTMPGSFTRAASHPLDEGELVLWIQR